MSRSVRLVKKVMVPLTASCVEFAAELAAGAAVLEAAEPQAARDSAIITASIRASAFFMLVPPKKLNVDFLFKLSEFRLACF